MVTAGHCTAGRLPENFKVRAGSSYRDDGGVEVQVKEIFMHPQYNHFTVDYDIAVLELETPLQFGPGIQPIGLPLDDQVTPEGSPGYVTGWGTTSEGGSSSLELRGVWVPVVNQDSCKQVYGETAITDRMLCAGVPEGGKDSCQGDSGGPLVVDSQLIGIVSWGQGCARPGVPGVYAKVAALRDFIREHSGV